MLLATDEQYVTATYNAEPGSDPLTIQWDGRTFVLPAGRAMPIPMAAAHLWFGDPRVVSNVPTVIRDPQNPANTQVLGSLEEEVRRLKMKWGNHEGREDEFNSIPDVTVRALEDDSEITTVLQNPTGTSVTQTGVQTDTDTMATIKFQARQIALLEQRLGALEDDPDDSPVPVDSMDGVMSGGITSSGFTVPSDDTPTDDDGPEVFGGAADEGA